MTHWIKDAIDTARLVRRIRMGGETCDLILITEDTWKCCADTIHRVNMDRNQLYRCVEAMGDGKSRCAWCYEHDTCKSRKKGTMRGCPEWMLKWEEKYESAAATENRAAEQEDQTAGVPGDVEGTADGRPGEERDHGGGSQK